MQNFKGYKSKIDKRFIIFILYPYNEIFKKYSNLFKKDIFLGNDALCDTKNKIIMINGKICENWTENHFLAVEAHEISHLICGHKKMNNLKSEQEADKMAMNLLFLKGHFKAYKLLKNRFTYKYGYKSKHVSLKTKLIFKLIFYLISGRF